MSYLIQITHSGIFSLEKNEVEFEAEFKDYTITGSIECEIRCDEGDSTVGLKNSYYLFTQTYWNIEVRSPEGVKISLGREEMQSCECEIENYITKLIDNL